MRTTMEFIAQRTTAAELFWSFHRARCSFDEFCELAGRDERIFLRIVANARRLQRDSGDDRAALMNAAALQMYMLHQWASFGCNLFHVQPDLAAALVLTTCTAERYKLPFPSLLVRVGEGLIPVFGETKDTVRWATTVTVAEVDGCIFAQCVVPAGGHVLLKFARETLESLDKLDAPSNDSLLAASDDYVLRSDEKLTIDATQGLLRGLAVWLDASPALSRLSRRKRPSKHHEWPTHWNVHANTIDLCGLREAATDYVLQESKRERKGWRLRMQQVVRGHWKKQACGIGRMGRRTIWINPYIRGPDGMAAWSHFYNAKDGVAHG